MKIKTSEDCDEETCFWWGELVKLLPGKGIPFGPSIIKNPGESI